MDRKFELIRRENDLRTRRMLSAFARNGASADAMKSLADVLGECVRALDQLGVPYAVMGGIAVLAHAIPRVTQDVDLTIAMARPRLTELYDALEKRGYTIPDPYRTGRVDEVAGMAVE